MIRILFHAVLIWRNSRKAKRKKSSTHQALSRGCPKTTTAKYIDRSGEGIQHVALAVDNLEAALEALKANGVRLIDEKPRYGAGGKDIAFIHPKSTGGILLELGCPRKK